MREFLGSSVQAALLAGALTAMALPLVRSQLKRRSVLDIASERSSHTGSVVRGAGCAIAVGVTVAAVAFLPPTQAVLIFVISTLGFSAIGLVDDISPREPLPRLIAQGIFAIVIATAATAPLTESALISAAVALVGALWLVSYVNAFNFMDGIDGISGLTAAIVGVTYAILGAQVSFSLITTAGLALSAACLAFIPFNFSRSKIFLGDVGSYFIGAVIASLALFAFGVGASPVALLAPLALYLSDTATTLLRRARRGEDLLAPHREHVYQRLSRSSLGPAGTLSLVTTIHLVFAGAALTIETSDGPASTLATVVVVLGCLGYLGGAELYLDDARTGAAQDVATVPAGVVVREASPARETTR